MMVVKDAGPQKRISSILMRFSVLWIFPERRASCEVTLSSQWKDLYAGMAVFCV
jgi:predicted transcriptional regulator